MKNSAAITHTTESLCRKEQPEIIPDFHFSRRKYGVDRFEGLRGIFGQSFRFWSWIAENLHQIYHLWQAWKFLIFCLRFWQKCNGFHSTTEAKFNLTHRGKK